ncbi:MAG: nitroreductase family protein [Oscillospiraceae bacterium]|nr:nitroreductase family protein [Oscillospiraceae bacterium]
MEFNKLIQVRRSVRSYASAPSHEELVQILHNAQQAPSWKNSQTTRWYIAETPEKREELRLALHAANQKKAINAALIVSTYEKNIAGFTGGNPDNEVGNGWGAYDLGLHDAYLLLAAKDAGFDTLIMGLREGDKVRDLFSIPDSEEILSVIAIGKGAEEPAMRPRKPLEEIAFFA